VIAKNKYSYFKLALLVEFVYLHTTDTKGLYNRDKS